MATIDGDQKWLKLEKELDELRSALAEIRSALGGVRATLESSSRSPAPRPVEGSRESESSETGNQHEPPKMTFEEFANEAGLRF